MMSEGGPITRSRSRQSSAAGAGDEQQQQQQQQQPEGMVVGKAAEPAPASIAAEEEKGEEGIDAGTGFPSPDAEAAKKGPGGTVVALRKARRKLSIMSDNALVDGIADIELDDALTRNAEKGTGLACVVNSYAGATRKGYAPYNTGKKNQDALIMAEEPHTCSLLFCVLDGHGIYGELVSSFFQRELARSLFAHDDFAHAPARAFTEVVALLEARLLRDPGVDTDFSGTTLSAVLLRGDRLWAFNIGDSRVTAGVMAAAAGGAAVEDGAGAGAVAGAIAASSSSGSSSKNNSTPSPARRARMLRWNVGDDDDPPQPLFFQSPPVLDDGEGKAAAAGVGVAALPITVDHKPDLAEERARIVRAGGRVFAVEYDDGVDGPPRVWLGHLDIPGLAMSRSLGDAVAHSVGVSSEADVVERRVDPRKEHFLIIATDGLWEFVSDEEAVRIAAAARDPQEAVDALIREANRRWLQEEEVIDDTTVCVAFLGAWRSEGLTAPGSPYSPVLRK